MSTIVHVTAPAEFGGLERVVSGLSAALAGRGHHVVLVTVLEPNVEVPLWAASLIQAGVVVEPLHLGTRAYCEERNRVLDVLKTNNADVVHTHGYRSDFVDGSFAHRFGYPVVSTAHGFIRTRLKGRLYNRLQIRALRRFDAVVAVSAPLYEELRLAGVGSDRLIQISNGFVPSVEPSLDRAAARARLGAPINGPLIGWVGRVSPEKGPDVMLDALQFLKDRDANVCMVGDGPELTRIRRAAARLGLSSRTCFPGAITNAQSILRAFDVLALSSRSEGLPMVLLEAAWAGIPIVATAVGGVPALLEAGGGLLVPPEDPRLLAAALDAALGDPSGAAARARSLSGRLETDAGKEDWIDKYESLYERLRSRSTPTTHPSSAARPAP